MVSQPIGFGKLNNSGINRTVNPTMKANNKLLLRLKPANFSFNIFGSFFFLIRNKGNFSIWGCRPFVTPQKSNLIFCVFASVSVFVCLEKETTLTCESEFNLVLCTLFFWFLCVLRRLFFGCCQLEKLFCICRFLF